MNNEQVEEGGFSKLYLKNEGKRSEQERVIKGLEEDGGAKAVSLGTIDRNFHNMLEAELTGKYFVLRLNCDLATTAAVEGLARCFNRGVCSELGALRLSGSVNGHASFSSLLQAIGAGACPELRILEATAEIANVIIASTADQRALLSILRNPAIPLEFLDMPTSYVGSRISWKSDEYKQFSNDVLSALETSWTLRSVFYDWPSKSLAAKADFLLGRNRRIAGLDLSSDTVAPLAGKLLFCGDGRVGKTTLRATLTGEKDKGKLPEGNGGRNRRWAAKLCCRSASETRDTEARIREPTSSKAGQNLPVNPRLEQKPGQGPTRGWELAKLKWGRYQMMLVDCAGQEEYSILHRFLLPELTSQATVFVLVCDGTLQHLDEAKQKLLYWLRYLASSNRSSRLVKVVVNKREGFPTAEWWGALLGAMEDHFEDRITFIGEAEPAEPLLLDALQPRRAQIEALNLELQRKMQTLLSKSAPVPKVIDDVLDRLNEEARQKQGFPVVTWEHVRRTVFPEMDAGVLRNVVDYLHDIGELVSMGSVGNKSDDDLVVLDSEWFGREVAGELLFPKEFWSRQERRMRAGLAKYGRLKLRRFEKCWESIIKDTPFTAQALMDMLVKLELCYWTTPQKQEVLVPAFLPPKSTVQEQWAAAHSHSRVVGRKLRCEHELKETRVRELGTGTSGETGLASGNSSDGVPEATAPYGSQITLLPISIIYLLQVSKAITQDRGSHHDAGAPLPVIPSFSEMLHVFAKMVISSALLPALRYGTGSECFCWALVSGCSTSMVNAL
jgi:GTPase SAR1 family protein